MSRYEREAELIVQLGETRRQLDQALEQFFAVRDERQATSWWTRAGAGSSQALATALLDDLGADSDLRSYWYFPSGKHNPYLDLLYAELPTRGWRARELGALDNAAQLGSGSLLHVHWIESLRPSGVTVDEHRIALDRARTTLSDFVSDPANSLIWSVHEALPHGSEWPEEDARFHQFLSDVATAIHVTHPATASVCRPHFLLDDTKTFVVPLPLYSDVYPAYRSRQAARALLGLYEDQPAVVFFGALRAYKGLDRLLTTADELADHEFVIAGLPVGSASEFAENAGRRQNVRLAARLVPDTEVQTLMRAADVVVVPYETFLNSAVLMLALSFGVPVVAARNPVTQAAESSGLVHTFGPDDDASSLIAAVARAAPAAIDEHFASAHDASTLARSFADLVTEATARRR